MTLRALKEMHSKQPTKKLFVELSVPCVNDNWLVKCEIESIEYRERGAWWLVNCIRNNEPTKLYFSDGDDPMTVTLL